LKKFWGKNAEETERGREGGSEGIMRLEEEQEEDDVVERIIRMLYRSC
jgi:hypothetical protein